MRPNTSESGILRTKRSSAVSVSMLTRMLVPKPKNAFQSPGVHRIGLPDIASVSDVLIARPYAIIFDGSELSAVKTSVEELTQPKMPPCALIMRRPISWNSGK